MRELRLAILQLALARPDEADNIAAVAALVEEAAGKGAHVVLPPRTLRRRVFLPRGGGRPVRPRPPDRRASQRARHAGACGKTSYRHSHQLFRARRSSLLQHARHDRAGRRVDGHLPQEPYSRRPGYEEKYYFRPGNDGFKVWDVACDGGTRANWRRRVLGSVVSRMRAGHGAKRRRSAALSHRHRVRTLRRRSRHQPHVAQGR